MVLFISVGSVVTPTLSLLIFVICVFSLFFSLSVLLKLYQFYLFKDTVLSFINFLHFFLILFIFALCYFFPSAGFGFVSFFFYQLFKLEGYSTDFRSLFCSNIRICVVNFPLSTHSSQILQILVRCIFIFVSWKYFF